MARRKDSLWNSKGHHFFSRPQLCALMLSTFLLMNFFRRDELTPRVSDTLARYDETVRRFVGQSYPHPIRAGDWELSRALDASRSVPIGSSILDTGSYNSYLPLALAAAGYRTT